MLGEDVRWNGSNKLNKELIDWATRVGLDLIPVCPENELFGSPRPTIRLKQSGDHVQAMMGKVDVAHELERKCSEIISRYPDACGFIGISGSPSCGISVGVRGRGSTMKAYMHQVPKFPTTEINSLRTPKNRLKFLERIVKYITYKKPR